MKKAAYILIALGVVTLIFAAVCFFVADAMINDVNAYAAYMFGALPGVDADTIIKMVRDTGFAVDSFDMFAYDYRFVFLAAGGVLLAAGIVMLIAGRGRKHAAGGSRGKAVDRCPVCGAQVAADAAFCMYCGAHTREKPVIKPVSVDIEAVICQSCGTSNEHGSRFCQGCGTPLVRNAEAGAAKAKTVPAEDGTVRISAQDLDDGTVRISARDLEEGTVRIAADPHAGTDDEGTVYIRVKDND